MTWLHGIAVGLVLIGVADVMWTAWRMHHERLSLIAADLVPSTDEFVYAEGYGQWVQREMMRRIHERA